MNGRIPATALPTALLTALLTVACTGAEDSPAPAGDGEPAQESVEEVSGAEATGDDGMRGPATEAPPARRGGRMPMGGDMADMHARMMGGGSPEDAPEAEAATGRALGCPDVGQELVDRGREVWAGPGRCFSCHGGDGTGSQLAPALTDGEWLNVEGSYGSIAELVRTGVSQPRQYPAPMPPMGGGSLSQDQVCAVAAYVYSLSH